MADETRDLILRLNLQIADNKLPPIDTSQADAALEAFARRARERQRQLGAEGAAAIGGWTTVGGAAYRFSGGTWPHITYQHHARGPEAAPWGGPGSAQRYAPPGPWDAFDPNRVGWGSTGGRVGYTQYSYPAHPGGYVRGRSFGGASGTPGGTFGDVGNGWAMGPISDGGSSGRSSLSTARGYDQAMLRGRMGGMGDLGLDKLPSYMQSLDQLRMGMTRTREASIGLAAGIALLNNAFTEGSGWDNFHTKAIGGLMVGSYGLNAARGVGMGVRGVASAGSRLAGNLAIGAGGGAASRGLAMGARGLAGLAGASAFAIAAPLAVGVGLYGARRYYDGQAEEAYQQGLSLDEQISAANESRASRNFRNYSSDFRYLTGQTYGRAARSFLGGGGAPGSGAMADLDRGVATLSQRSRELAGSYANEFHPSRRGDMAEEQLAIGQQLEQLARMRLAVERQLRMEKEAQLKTDLRAAETERDRARAVAGGVGRLDGRDWRRLDRLARGPLSESSARAMEEILGAGNAGRASRYLDDAGQQRIDANPQLRPFLRGERTSGQLESIGQEIAEYKSRISGMETALKEAFDLFASFSERVEGEARYWAKKLGQGAADQLMRPGR